MKNLHGCFDSLSPSYFINCLILYPSKCHSYIFKNRLFPNERYLYTVKSEF